MKRFGNDLWDFAVRNQVITGIEYETVVQGWVAEFEMRQAAIFAGYTPTEFYNLDWRERVNCVAQYRLDKLIGLHVEDALTAAAEAKARRRRSGRGLDG